ncbi:MAG TPA: hypothetical protein VH117_01285 [Edaphobacter sp.]|nr:hypothetical protein [Edaphobacter sp.]
MGVIVSYVDRKRGVEDAFDEGFALARRKSGSRVSMAAAWLGYELVVG